MSLKPSLDGTTVDLTSPSPAAASGPVIDTKYLRRLMHDLSAPTRHVSFFSGFVDEALTEPLDLDDARRSLQTVRTAAERMQQLTNMVSLHMRSIETLHATAANPNQRFSEEAYGVAELVADAWQKVGGDASVLTVQGDTKTCVDRSLLEIPIQQVLRNAISFAEESRPLKVVVAIQQTSDMISVAVEDNGIGFDTQYAEKICEPFECLGTGKDRREGAGLGLTVASLVIDALAGALKLQSDDKSGTKVTMSWPHHCKEAASDVE
ncbi:HAMP domain-containing sensor histidine kinase [Rhodopirellula bahusiensis]|uniref:HAMP domain-containing sensor histidine kinase n=1 Tax=Rhodopirellula bahusiensis TaxID=2014065 RepID=UPI003264BEFB